MKPSNVQALKWQARRDSNPQHPVLETGALAVRATGLHAQKTQILLFGFLVWSVLTAEAAVFAELQLLWFCFLIFGCCIIPLFAFGAGEGNDVSHCSILLFYRLLRMVLRTSCLIYSIIELTTPAPTVRPPSRMAKRSPSSMAIGVIRLTVMATLSPGITISVPAGSSAMPVTSVVRK